MVWFVEDGTMQFFVVQLGFACLIRWPRSILTVVRLGAVLVMGTIIVVGEVSVALLTV